MRSTWCTVRGHGKCISPSRSVTCSVDAKKDLEGLDAKVEILLVSGGSDEMGNKVDLVDAKDSDKRLGVGGLV